MLSLIQGAEKFRVDLHVHTSYGSPCAELHDPESLPETMVLKGLSGVVVTEHDMFWPDGLIRSLNARLPQGMRIYSGIEVSTSVCHVVVVGLDDTCGIYPGMGPDLLVEITEKNRAAAILVHPYHSSNGFDPARDNLPGFHGMEVASTTTRGDSRMKTISLCRTTKAFPVAGSDAHCSGNLGKAFTCFPRLPSDEKELALMIRTGLGIPMVRENSGPFPGEDLIVC
jgi:hypothetical protein